MVPCMSKILYYRSPFYAQRVYMQAHTFSFPVILLSHETWSVKKKKKNLRPMVYVCIWIYYYSRIIIILFKKKSMKLLLRVKWSFSKSTILIDLRQFTLFYFLIITYYPKKQKLLRGLTVTISFFFLCFRMITRRLARALPRVYKINALDNVIIVNQR
jgi:hypothetical protein